MLKNCKSWQSPQRSLTYVAFTLNGFDDQKRNQTFVKTDFQDLNSNFVPAIFKQLFYPLKQLYILYVL